MFHCRVNTKWVDYCKTDTGNLSMYLPKMVRCIPTPRLIAGIGSLKGHANHFRGRNHICGGLSTSLLSRRKKKAKCQSEDIVVNI